MTSTFLSTLLVLGWFVLPQLVGLRFGWRGVVVATLVYAVVVPMVALMWAGELYLAGSLPLLPLMALFVMGLNVALFALLVTIADLFRAKPKDAPR